MMRVMVFLVLSAIVLAISLFGVAQAGRREIGYWRARRTGVELQAEVVDNEATPSSRQRGAYNLVPIVRYHLGERPYQASVVNASGVPGDRGSFMTILVRPDSPYEPYDRYQGMGAAARGSILLFVFAVGLLFLALAVL
jgi:hypothetical protein